MLKIFRLGNGDQSECISIDRNNIAEIHFIPRKSFKLTTRDGVVYDVIGKRSGFQDNEMMYLALIQALNFNDIEIPGFFLKRKTTRAKFTKTTE